MKTRLDELKDQEKALLSLQSLVIMPIRNRITHLLKLLTETRGSTFWSPTSQKVTLLWENTPEIEEHPVIFSDESFSIFRDGCDTLLAESVESQETYGIFWKRKRPVRQYRVLLKIGELAIDQVNYFSPNLTPQRQVEVISWLDGVIHLLTQEAETKIQERLDNMIRTVEPLQEALDD